jgi:acyl-coenzyme A thioesterase PaaI-like protein
LAPFRPKEADVRIPAKVVDVGQKVADVKIPVKVTDVG